MLSKELISKIKNVELKTKLLATDALSGEYLSAFKGIGIEFEKVREYMPGDEVRAIDWNVTARMNSPFVKVYQEERELTVNVIVDVSSSQYLGTLGLFKQEISAEFAALIAFLGDKNNDKVGLLVFSDHVEQFIPPAKGRGHIWNIIRTVLSHEAKGTQTDIRGACEYAMRVFKRKSMIFLISDFVSSGYQDTLRSLSKKHDLICGWVCDPLDSELPSMGYASLVDPETGKTVLVNTSKKSVQEQYKRAYEKKRDELFRFFSQSGISSLTLKTSESVGDSLVQFLRKRERRMS